jgi:NAD(P)-dependent dehydrogenase (short-subunit alcohol dehydrogenase family)
VLAGELGKRGITVNSIAPGYRQRDWARTKQVRVYRLSERWGFRPIST